MVIRNDSSIIDYDIIITIWSIIHVWFTIHVTTTSSITHATTIWSISLTVCIVYSIIDSIPISYPSPF